MTGVIFRSNKPQCSQSFIFFVSFSLFETQKQSHCRLNSDFQSQTDFWQLSIIGTGGGSKSPPSNVVVSHIDQALWYYHIVVMIGGRKSPSLFALLDIIAMVGGRKSPSFFPSLDIRH